MSPFSLLLLVGTCSAFLHFEKVDDGVIQWPSLSSVFPPLRRSSLQRSPDSLFFPIRPMIRPQATFFWNRHNSGGHWSFPGFSQSLFTPFPIVRPTFTPKTSNNISPLLNFFNNFLDSPIDFVLSIEDNTPEDDDSAIGTEKLDPSFEEDASQRNDNLYEKIEGDDVKMMDPSVDENFEGNDTELMNPKVVMDFASPKVNLTKDMKEDYEDKVIDTDVLRNATLLNAHFDDILEEIFETREDDDLVIGTEKLDPSVEEDPSQRNVNLDDILDEIFEGDDIEMMDLDVAKNSGAQKIKNLTMENAKLSHNYFDDILEEIFENDNNEILDSNVEKSQGFQNLSKTNYMKEDSEDEVINRAEILQNDDNEMLYPNVEKHTKEMNGEYDQELEPTIILFR